MDKKFDVMLPFGREARDAMAEMYGVFDERVYEWAAKTWDPEIGGFYHTLTARDTEGFLPDIESTKFVLALIGDTGMACEGGGNYAKTLPRDVGEKIVAFVNSLADPDGYYYHPQWGKIVKPSKKGRDMIWAQVILEHFEREPVYPFATKQMEKGEASSSIPEYFKSAKLLREYMEGIWADGNSYVNGQTISAQTSMIVAAGLSCVEEEFFNEKQFSENGLWEKDITYNSISGLLKIGSAYNTMKKPIPNWERTLESSISYVISDDVPHALTGAYNAVQSIDRIITNLRVTGRADKIPYVQNKVRENAAAIIKATKRRIEKFRREDGAFSYFTDTCCPSIQGCPASTAKLPESDTDGMMLAVNACMGICELLGIPRIPMFDANDMKRFNELLLAVEPVVKTKPRPSDEVMKIKL